MVFKKLILTLFCFAALSTIAPVAAQQTRAGDSWLDRPLANWNRRAGGFPLLPRPPTVQGESATASRCREQARQPASAAERALVRRGWMLYGATQSYGRTKIVTALSGFDGMCRPLGFHAFVYWEGRYAGTLSPAPMDSRTDGALTNIRPVSETSIAADFARYSERDAPCCPSRSSAVLYTLRRDDIPDLTPARVTTTATCRTGEQADSGDNATSLFDRRWVLTEIGEQRLSADKPYIEFDREQRRASGDSGCNRFSGGFEMNGTSLKFSRIASTRRACLSEEANRLETNLLRSLEATTRFDAQGNTLRLYADDRLILVFAGR